MEKENATKLLNLYIKFSRFLSRDRFKFVRTHPNATCKRQTGYD
jgi:hypothetical protein